ncbi:hypothetical protein SUGI_0258580 [Cryptomeria japonica]|nr:hypothetical protein SUGI_0258580 [Cryptomeria japonica]
MIPLLSIIVVMEGIVAILMTVDVSPVRKVARKLDYAKSSKRTAVIRTLSGTMFVILVSSISSIMKIQDRSREHGATTPTDQILMQTHLLEASLMGMPRSLCIHFTSTFNFQLSVWV